MHQNYVISKEKGLIDFEFVYTFLNEVSPWSRGIPRSILYKAIQNSVCFGMYDNSTKRQVGFARVITDLATFAYIDDVFIDTNLRALGLGKKLLTTILEDEELRDVKSWWLLTGSEEARRFFESMNFCKPEPERLERWMAIPGRSRGYWK